MTTEYHAVIYTIIGAIHPLPVEEGVSSLSLDKFLSNQEEIV